MATNFSLTYVAYSSVFALLVGVNLFLQGCSNETTSALNVGGSSVPLKGTESVPFKCGVVVKAANEGGGMAFTPAMLVSGRRAGLQWHTNWKLGPSDGFTAADYGNVKMVPQQWTIDVRDIPIPQSSVAKIMLGMNEPDQAHSGGSNTDARSTLDAWMTLVQKAKIAGYEQFVAPSIAYSIEWLTDFLNLCLQRSGCKETIDYLGFHLYEPNCPTDKATVKEWNIDRRVGPLKRLMQSFNSQGMNIKGLWLTEFAGRSNSAGGPCSTLAQQQAWMEVFLPMLNAETDVVAYSWFSYGEGRSPHFHDNANLWDYQTNELNSLGQKYFELCAK